MHGNSYSTVHVCQSLQWTGCTFGPTSIHVSHCQCLETYCTADKLYTVISINRNHIKPQLSVAIKFLGISLSMIITSWSKGTCMTIIIPYTVLAWQYYYTVLVACIYVQSRMELKIYDNIILVAYRVSNMHVHVDAHKQFAQDFSA